MFAILFRARLEKVFKHLGWEETRITIDGEYVRISRIAGDIVLLSNESDKLENMIDDPHREIIKIGLKMNMQNTLVFYAQ